VLDSLAENIATLHSPRKTSGYFTFNISTTKTNQFLHCKRNGCDQVTVDSRLHKMPSGCDAEWIIRLSRYLPPGKYL
jgi:hypothetical protein